ncbi:MAG: phosphate signaling complex protein PhoU [Syntrophobacteraceae bacterium]|jgi:phosphate transport system protein
MLRSALEKELDRVQNELLNLGNLVYHSIIKSIEVLKEGDIDAAKQLIAADIDLNRRRFEIESEVLVLIARQQPIARDLRTTAAVLGIATELERIADYAKSNARNTIKLGTKPPVTIVMKLSQMAEKASGMLQGALKSFTGRDVEMARRIASKDPEVDSLYDEIYRELMTYVVADPGSIEGSSDLMWVAHNLERTADRAVNICERVIFTVTGEMKELDESERGLLGAWPQD